MTIDHIPVRNGPFRTSSAGQIAAAGDVSGGWTEVNVNPGEHYDLQVGGYPSAGVCLYLQKTTIEWHSSANEAGITGQYVASVTIAGIGHKAGTSELDYDPAETGADAYTTSYTAQAAATGSADSSGLLGTYRYEYQWQDVNGVISESWTPKP